MNTEGIYFLPSTNQKLPSEKLTSKKLRAGRTFLSSTNHNLGKRTNRKPASSKYLSSTYQNSPLEKLTNRKAMRWCLLFSPIINFI